jgi:hypothetical protein
MSAITGTSRRTSTRVAWSLWSLICLLAAGVVVLSVLNRGGGLAGATPVVDVLAVAALIAFSTIGAQVAGRRPENPIGWLLVAAGLLSVASGFASGYAVHALFTDPGTLPGGTWAAWFSAWSYIPSIIAAPALVFLLFPDGRLAGRGGRVALWILVAATAAASIDAALAPVLDDAPFEGLRSPLPVAVSADTLAPLADLGWPGMVVGLVLAAVAMIGRLRRARGIERQQLKWVAGAAALLPPIIVAGVAFYYAGHDEFGAFLVDLSWWVILLAAGYAILRHRLYDIDLIINRTLVYGSVTALLAAGYAGLVLILRSVFDPLTRDNGFAVAVSTLAVAALFGPARRRVQAVVDRRFYRHKYDAARTLERFAAGLRSETDLDKLRANLTAVVHDTMQPTHVSLWLWGERPAPVSDARASP